MSAHLLSESAMVQHGDPALEAEYAALIQRAGAIVLPDIGVLRIAGHDRADWLDNLITANVETMAEGSAIYSLLLDGKAHVLADFVLLRRPDEFLLYTSRAAHEQLAFHLRRAIFRAKITLTDVSDQFGVIALIGPQARAIALKTFGDAPISESLISNCQLPLTNHRMVAIPNPRFPNRFDFLAPHDAILDLNRALVGAEAVQVSRDALDIARVQAGIAQYGDDFDETTLAPEARLDAFIAPNKGCYPGQEIIARIRNLGHVNRLLSRLEIEGDVVPERDDRVFADEKEIGNVTSAVWSFERRAPLALGYIRTEWAAEGARVQIGHGSVPMSASVLNL